MTGDLVPIPGERPKLLIVDDEEIIRNRLEELGKSMNLEVYTAEDGVDGVFAFNEVKPDVVILDVYMPRKNGLKALQDMKGIDNNVKVILITGYLRFEQIVQTGGVGADAYLEKPFNLETMSNLINDMLDERIATA
ncbi:response regulator [bacterium]|nr:response regulator [bacterium]MBU1651587.1 response regulator [bacterium]MBU1880744.1 response regulator [bacterium]